MKKAVQFCINFLSTNSFALQPCLVDLLLSFPIQQLTAWSDLHLQTQQASFYKKILEGVPEEDTTNPDKPEVFYYPRVDPEYFRVAYYGQSFPAFVRVGYTLFSFVFFGCFQKS